MLRIALLIVAACLGLFSLLCMTLAFLGPRAGWLFYSVADLCKFVGFWFP